MTYTSFDLELRDKVAHLRFNRPDKLNTLTREFYAELAAAVRTLDEAAQARVVVISSTGKHFTAGMDLSVFAGSGLTGASNITGSAEQPAALREVGRVRETLRRHVLELQASFSALEEARMPVLAAIQGGCIGGGVDMVSACDARYCTKDAFFCIQEINIGMVADLGTLQRLPRIMPEGLVRELAYTGRRLSAERALACGLVNEVFDAHDALVAGVLAVAAEIAERSPLAVYGSKEMLNYSRDHSVRDSLNYIATWQTGMFQGADMFEAFGAKNEKRKPSYQDLAPIKKF